MCKRGRLFSLLLTLLVFVILLTLAACGRLHNCFAEADLSTPDWENPEVVGVNKEPGHCTLTPLPRYPNGPQGRPHSLAVLQITQRQLEVPLGP